MSSTNKTTHYNLSQYVGSDKPTYLVDYNQDMSRIDTGIYEADAKAVINATNIGDLTDLTTTDKLSIVNAINEVNSESSSVGDLQDLTTTDKSSVVGAVNEVNTKANKIGDLTDLTTTDKTSIVNATNEVNAKANTIGNLSSLTTAERSSVVGAVNEVNAKANTIGNLSDLTTTDKTSIVNATNEVKEEVDDIKGVLLWENTSPTTNFNEQTITLSDTLANYDRYEIIYKQSTSVNRYLTTGRIPVGHATEMNFISTKSYYRVLNDSNTMLTNQILISEGKRVDTYGSSIQDNSFIIPVYIYAYKSH